MEKERSSKADGLVLVIIMSTILIILGLVLYINPEFEFSIFIRILASLMVIYGIVEMAYYWAKGEYTNIHSYRFAIGLIVGTLGVYIMVKASQFNSMVVPMTGALLLVVAVVMLQYALQIRMLQGKAFAVSMVLAAVVYLISLFAFLDPGDVFENNLKVLYVLTTLSGVLGLISMLLTVVRIKNYEKPQVL
nr:DUF308 domain-containing protein [Lachnospiraceae bacterium]